jgi:hypothetical protein
MKPILEKIGKYVLICVGCLAGTAFLGWLAGSFTIFLVNKVVPSFPGEFFAPAAHNIADWRNLVVVAIGWVAILCFFLIRYLVSRTPWMIQRHAKETRKTEHEKQKTSRKRWIIGLSIVALFCVYESTSQCVRHYKRFNKADRDATGYVLESDPGTPGHSGPDGDAGDPAWSYYQFRVDGKTYDGGTDYELARGETIQVRYSSSDPSFNHAQDDDQSMFQDWFHHGGFLLMLVLVGLVWFIRNKREPEYP